MTPTSESVLDRARRIADEVLFPIAQEVDRAPRVPASSLHELAHAGLFGMAGPASHGGLDLPRDVAWRVAAAIGGACGATFFVWAQHHTAVRTLRTSANTKLVDDLLEDLCAGRAISGVAFAHLRRADPPSILATRVEGGWVLDGFSPWTTSWGLADWFAIAGESADRELVWTLVPAGDASGVTATPLALPVLMSTGTVLLRFQQCFVPDSHVMAVGSADRWRHDDRFLSAIGVPIPLAIAQRAARLLAELGEHDPLALEASGRLVDECDLRAAAIDDLLASMDDSEDYVARASDHRAACLHLAQRATTALLAASGGRGMDLAHPAQRLAREASFYVIQAQTADGRAATLRST